MSLQDDHQHLNDILEATHAAAFEFLESLATRPAGRIMTSSIKNYDDAAEILTETYSGSNLCNSSLTLWRSSMAGFIQ